MKTVAAVTATSVIKSNSIYVTNDFLNKKKKYDWFAGNRIMLQ